MTGSDFGNGPAPRRHNQPGSGVDAERLRYFTRPDGEPRPGTRHRRRRADGDTSVPIWQTGQVPRIDDRLGADRAGADRGGADRPGEQRPGEQRPERGYPAPDRPEAPVDSGTGRVLPTRIPADDGEPNIRRHLDPTGPRAAAEPSAIAEHRDEVEQELFGTGPLPPAALARDDHPGPASSAPTPAGGFADLGLPEPGDDPADENFGVDDPEAEARDTGRPRGSGRRRNRKRVVLAVVVACLIVMVGGLGYYGLRFLGVIGASDFTNAAGTSDVLVTIPPDASLRDFGKILVDKNVVASVRAFTDAADGQPLSAGIYKLRTEVPAATAVKMLDDSDMSYRVGRVVVPEGVQLDSKTGVDGKVTKGIFDMIAAATSTSVNGTAVGVSAQELAKAAADGSVTDLGIPAWAKTEVTALTGDYRRVEGLIAPGAWESIDPTETATQILRGLITDSAARYEQWGLLSSNSSDLSPYQALTAASIVEREVRHPEDYSKVARVILNRLKVDQLLQMDSTANYTAAVTNIDVHGAAYKADNAWNTYRVKGLPPTPIAAVGKQALQAIESPAPGNWLYFITIDKAGTTLFADTFDEHKKNREKACANKFLSTGCE